MPEESPEFNREDNKKEVLYSEIGESNTNPEVSFSFDGSIDELDLDSNVTKLNNNKVITLRDAFDLVRMIWEYTNAATTMIQMICKDFEGQILLLENGEIVRTANHLKVRPMSEFQRQINLNRFAFDNSIVNLESDSSVKYLADNSEISLSEAFEKGLDNWSMGFAPSNLVFIVSHDFDGYLIESSKEERGFAKSINELIIDTNDKSDPLKLKLIGIIHQFKKGKRENYAKTVELIDDILDKEGVIKRWRYYLTCLKGKSLLFQFRYQESIDTLLIAENEYLTFSEDERKHIDHERRSIFNHIYAILWDKIFYEFDYPTLLNLKGLAYRRTGEYDTALENFINAYNNLEQTDNLEDIANILNNIGLIYYEKKDFELAIEYYNRSSHIYEKIGMIKRLLMTFRNVSLSCLRMDLCTKGIEYAKKSLALSIELNNIPDLVNSYFHLGNTYLFSENLLQAKVYFEKSLSLQKQLNNKEYFAFNLYSLVLINIDCKAIGEVEKYYNELRKLNTGPRNSYITVLTHLAYSRLLIEKNEENSIQMAKQILQKIIQDETTIPEFKAYGFVLLTDLILLQLKKGFENIIIAEINNLLLNLMNFAKQFNINSLVAITLIIHYKIALYEGKNNAEELIEEAKKYAELYHLNNVKKIINQEIKYLQTINEYNLEMIVTSRKMLVHEIQLRKFLLEFSSK